MVHSSIKASVLRGASFASRCRLGAGRLVCVVVTVLFGLIAAEATRLYAADINWNGAGGNANWGTGGNWIGGSAPGTGDNAWFTRLGLTTTSPVLAASTTISNMTLSTNYLGGGWSFTGANTLTIGSSSNGVLATRGPGTYTFNGPTLTAATGKTIGLNVGTSSTLWLQGTSAISNAGAATLAGGTLVLDNSGSNVQRFGGAVNMNGGTLQLIGNASSATTMNLGIITNSAGINTVNLVYNGQSVTVSFSNNGTSLRDQTFMSVNFTTNGVLGTNAFVKFAGSPINTTAVTDAAGNHPLANSATGNTIGWATVNDANGPNWAVWSAASASLVAASPNVTAVTWTDLSTATTANVVQFNPAASATVSALGTVNAGLLRITPQGGGATLDVGSNNLTPNAVMVAGSNDFTLTGNLAATLTTSGTHYVDVAVSTTALYLGIQLAAATGNPTDLSGPGFIILTGAGSQNALTGANRLNILNGTLRGSATQLGFSSSGGGSFALRGGVLEIAGGGDGTGSSADFTRNLSGANAAGVINWSSTTSGDTVGGSGGFSAFGANASVNLGGNATPSTLNWASTATLSGGFVTDNFALVFGSTRSNARLDFLNPIALDGGTAGNYLGREIRVVGGVGGDYTFLQGTLSGSSSTDLVKTGTGILQLSDKNTYNGDTQIYGGSVRITSDTGLGTAPGSVTSNSILMNGGGIELNGSAGYTLNANRGITLGASNGSFILSDSAGVTYGGIITGPGSLTIAGSTLTTSAGVLVLTGANNYSGGTTISGGTVVVANSSGSALGSGNVVVTNGVVNVVTAAGGSPVATTYVGVLASGTVGTVSGNVAVNNGAIVNPGFGSTGTLNIGGNLTANSGGAKFNFALGAVTTATEIKIAGTLTLGSGDVLNISSLSGFAAGTYQLFTFNNETGTLSLGTTPGGAFSYALGGSGTEIDLIVSAVSTGSRNLLWSAAVPATSAASDGSGTWDTSTQHWWNATATTATTWDSTRPDNATFGASSSGTGGTITLGTNITVGSLTFAQQNAGSGYTLVGNGNTLTVASGITANNAATIAAPVLISTSETWAAASGVTLSVTGSIGESVSSRALTFSGPGSFFLSGSNSYSGGTFLAGGTLIVTADAALGASSAGLTTSGGAAALQLAGSTFSSTRLITLGATANTINIGNGPATFSGGFAGAGALTVTGSGTLALDTTANVFAGAVTLSAPTVSINVASTFSGGLAFTGNALGGSATVTASSYQLQSGTVSLALAGAGAVVKSGGGTLVLSANNSYSGGTQIIGGVLRASSNANLGASSGAITINSGATLQATGSIVGTRAVSVGAGGGTIDTGGNNMTVGSLAASDLFNKAGSGNLTVAGAISAANGAIAVASGALIIAPTSAGVALDTLATSSVGGNFTGSLEIVGPVLVTVTASTGQTSAVIDGGGTITFAGNTGTTYGGLIAASPTNGVFVTITNNIAFSPSSSSGSFGAVFGAGSPSVLTLAGNISGTGDLVISSTYTGITKGAGTLVLSGNNTYYGMTDMLLSGSGKVLIGSNGALSPNSTLVFGQTLYGQAAATAAGIVDLSGNNGTIAGLSTALTSGALVQNSSFNLSTLTIQGTGTNTYAASIGSSFDNIALVLSSANTATQWLASDSGSSYGGGTTVSGGVLAIANSSGSALGSGDVTVNAGGTLLVGATGASISGNVILNGGQLSVGNGSVATFTLGQNLTIAAGSTLSFALASGSSNSQINLGFNNLTLSSGSGSAITVNLANAGGLHTGTYSLITYGSETNANNLSFLTGTHPAGYTFGFVIGASEVDVTVSLAASQLLWSATTPTSSTSASDGAGFWGDGTGSFWNLTTDQAVTFSNAAGDSVTFGNGGTGGVITLSSDVSVGTITFEALTSTPYTITGSHTISLVGGIVANYSAAINSAIAMQASQVWTVTGSQTLTVAGSISQDGSASSLTLAGPGTVALLGVNSYSGGTFVTGGTLSVNGDAALGASTAGLTLNGGALQTATSSFATARAITIGSFGGTIDTAGNMATLSGSVIDTAGGTFTKSGPGTLVVTSTFSPAGGLNVSSGSLQLNSAFTATNSATIANGANLVLAQTAGSQTLSVSSNFGQFAGNIVLAGATELDIVTASSSNGELSGGGKILFQASGAALADQVTATSTINITNNLVLNSNNLSGSFNVFIGTNNSDQLNLSGSISGGSAGTNLIFGNGASGGGKGLVVLSGHNTYQGVTIIDNSGPGSVQLNSPFALPTGTVIQFGDGGAFNSSKNPGTLDLNTYDVTVSGLVTNLTTSQTATGIANSGIGTSTIHISTSTGHTYTFSSAIGTGTNITIGAGNFTSADTNDIALELLGGNTGTQVLNNSGGNLYTGGTTVNGGTLIVANTSGSALGTGAVTVNGGTLASAAGGAAISGLVTLNGGSLAPGNGAVGTLTLSGGLTLNDTSLVQLALGSPGSNSKIQLAGSALTFGSGTETLSLSGSLSGTGSYALFVGASGITHSGTVVVNAAALTLNGFTYSLQFSASEVDLVVSNSQVFTGNLTWTASQSSIWNTTALNWDDNGGAVAFTSSNNVTFSNTGAGAVTISNSGSAVLPGSVLFTNTAGNTYTLSGDPIGGAGSLTLSGSGQVVLNNQNVYTGGTFVNAGTLLIGSLGSLSTSSNLTVGSGGTALFNNAGQQLGVVTNTGALSFTANSGTITLSQLTGSGTTSFGSNASIATLSGGNVTIASLGTLGAVSNAAVTFAGATANTITSLNGTGSLTLSQSGTSLSVDSGSFGGSIAGAGSLQMSNGSGTLSLSGNSAYSGGTNLQAGTINVGSATALGSGTITFNGGYLADTTADLTLSNSLAINTTNGGFYVASGLTVTETGSISGSVALTKLGGGTLILTGINTSNAPTDVTSGTVSGNANSAGPAVQVSSGATYQFDQTSPASYNGTITGGGNIEVTGGSTLTLSGTNSSYSGSTLVNAATLYVGAVGNLGTGGIGLTNGTLAATLSANLNYSSPVTLSGNNNITLNGSGSTLSLNGGLTGSGNLTVVASGNTVVLSTASSGFNGALTIGSGIVDVNANNALGSATITVSTGSALVFNNQTNYSGTNSITLFGNGGGSGALQFSGNTSFGGNLTVGGGAGSTTLIELAPGSVTTLTGQLNKQGTTFVFESQGASLFINGTLIGVNGAYNSDVIFAGNTITQSNYTVNSTQTYDGLTEVTSGSHLIMGTANALPASTDVLIDKTGGVPTVLDLNSFNLTIRSLNSVSGDGSNAQVSNSGGAAATLTIAMTGTASNQGIATFNGVISGTNLNLVVHGNSSDATSTAQILAGNNNYSGSTLVSTGALLVASSGTIGGSGVTVGNLGLIGGSGTISSSINVQSGGYVSPGMNTASNSAASAGILHVGSNVSVAGTYIWDAVNLDLTHTGSGAVGAAGTNFDQIAMTAGNFTISGGTISLNFASSIDLATHTTSTFWSASEKWQILSGANTINGTPLFSMSGGSFDSSGNVTVSGTLLGAFAFDSSGFLDWTPVPEPGSLALAGFAAAGLAGYAWRRRKNKAQTTTLLSSGDDANTGGLLNECFREVIHE